MAKVRLDRTTGANTPTLNATEHRGQFIRFPVETKLIRTVTMTTTQKQANESKQLLICPARDLRTESQIDIQVAETLFELVSVIEAGALAVAIGNPRVLKVLVEFSDLFDVTPAVFSGVPGCDYDVAFEQITWSLDRVGYDAIVLEAASIDRMDKLKEAERPKMAGGVNRPRTRDEVEQIKIPSKVDVYGWDADSSTEV